MEIVIIGTGAMGCLYGAKLSLVPENKVYLLASRTEYVDAINSRGILLESDGEVVAYKNVVVSTETSSMRDADLVIVFVKSHATKQAVFSNIEMLKSAKSVLTLQNGLGNAEIISEAIGSANVIAGTTAHGATVIEPGKVRHAGVGPTIIGEIDSGITARTNTICELFKSAGIETTASDDITSIIWKKLLVNVGINALTGITKLRNGQLLDHLDLMEIMNRAITEAKEVAKAKGIDIGDTDHFERAKEVCKKTAQNKASMLQDILNHKETEIDMINGAIVREGSKFGIETPTNLVLTNLIKAIQEINK
jgi:2-dehydropantoate 2-reductase